MLGHRDHWETERYLTGLQAFNVVSFSVLLLSCFFVYGQFIGTPVPLVTERWATYLTPAHWTFDLLGLVVLLQLMYTIYQAIPYDAEKTPYINRLNFWLPTTWIFEAAAIVSFSFEIIWLALIFNTVALVFLSIAYYRINELKFKLPHIMSARIDGIDKACCSFYYLLFYAPTSMNLALLVVGWVLNLLMTFQYFGHHVPLVVAVVASAVAAVLGFVMLGVKKDVLYALTISWCLLGVGSRWIDTQAIAIPNILGAALLFIVTIIIFGTMARKHSKNLLEKEGIESRLPTSSTSTTASYYQTGSRSETRVSS